MKWNKVKSFRLSKDDLYKMACIGNYYKEYTMLNLSDTDIIKLCISISEEYLYNLVKNDIDDNIKFNVLFDCLNRSGIYK